MLMLWIMQNHVFSPRDDVESRICIFDKKSPCFETVSMAGCECLTSLSLSGNQVIETPGSPPSCEGGPSTGLRCPGTRP